MAKRCAQAAYTVYLIHPLFIALSQYLYIAIVRATGLSVFVYFTDDDILSKPSNAVYCILGGGRGTLWAGFWLQMLLVHATVWPCALAIKRIFDSERLPWLNRIL